MFPVCHTTKLILMCYFQPPRLCFNRYQQPGYSGYSSWPHQNNPVCRISYALFPVCTFFCHHTATLIRLCFSSRRLRRRRASTTGLDPTTRSMHRRPLHLTYKAMSIINHCRSSHYCRSSRLHLAWHLDLTW